MEVTIIKSSAMTLIRPPQCKAFSRALMAEKWLFPLLPVGVGGAGGGGGGGGGSEQWLQMTSALL